MQVVGTCRVRMHLAVRLSTVIRSILMRAPDWCVFPVSWVVWPGAGRATVPFSDCSVMDGDLA